MEMDFFAGAKRHVKYAILSSKLIDADFAVVVVDDVDIFHL